MQRPPVPQVAGRRCSHGNPLHDIPADFFLPSIIEAGGAGVGMTGQVLYVFARHVLFEQVGDRGDAEGVRGSRAGASRSL